MKTPNTASSIDMTPANVEHARHLIPGFLKKSLSDNDKEWMTQFLNQLRASASQGIDADISIGFEQEMAWIEQTQTQLAQHDPVFDTQQGWQRMRSLLESEVTTQIPRPSLAHQVITWIQAFIHVRSQKWVDLWKKPLVGALASAMIVGQMGLLAAMVRMTYNAMPQPTTVSLSSGESAPPDSAVLAVVFKDQATQLDMRTLLDGLQAQVVGGPGAIGVWQVSVPKDKLSEALQSLGRAKIVESVEVQ